ncbi:MAG: TrbI/VirB10 family protein, partial [Alphaproteobacteria bacterium]
VAQAHGRSIGQDQAAPDDEGPALPDGSSVGLGDMPASDGAGYVGLSDQVDRHTGRLLRGVALATLLGVGAETTIGGDGDLVRAIREATQQSVSRAGDQIVAKEIGVAPTVTVRPGWPVRVLVNKDLNLLPWSDPR